MEPSEILEQAIENSTNILNPFKQKLEFTLYDKIKIGLLTVTLFPIRVLVFFVFFVVAWLLTKVVITEKDFLQKPISGWRKHILKPMVHGSLRVSFAAAGFIGVEVRGQLASQKEAPILIMAPHSSFWEIIPIVMLGGPSVLAKIETSKVPIYGDFITFSQPVYVQQDDKLSRKQTVSEIRYRAFSNGDWQQIAIFPEGTCTNRTALINFKKGAFYPGVSIQPVCISYPNRLDTVSWTWRGYGGFKNTWLAFCQFRNYCVIDVLPVYKPSKAEIHDARLFARNVQNVMAKHLKVPTSDWAFSDIRFIKKASGINVPVSIPVIKLMKLRNFLKTEEESLESAIKNFETRLKTCSATTSDYYSFSQLLDIEASETSQEFFDSVDQDKQGTVDVRSYLCCLWFLRTDLPIWERILEACKVLSNPPSNECVEDMDVIATEEIELKLEEFCLLTWLLLTVPRTQSEKIFIALEKGNGTLSSGDLLKCLENSQSARSIICAVKDKQNPKKRLVCDNEFFEKCHTA